MNKQGVESSDGYILQRVHRFYYEYREGDHRLRVDIEPGDEAYDIYLNSFKNWLPPYDSEPISKELSLKLQKRVSKALWFMGTPHSFVWANSGPI